MVVGSGVGVVLSSGAVVSGVILGSEMKDGVGEGVIVGREIAGATRRFLSEESCWVSISGFRG